MREGDLREGTGRHGVSVFAEGVCEGCAHVLRRAPQGTQTYTQPRLLQRYAAMHVHLGARSLTGPARVCGKHACGHKAEDA